MHSSAIIIHEQQMEVVESNGVAVYGMKRTFLQKDC